MEKHSSKKETIYCLKGFPWTIFWRAFLKRRQEKRIVTFSHENNKIKGSENRNWWHLNLENGWKKENLWINREQFLFQSFVNFWLWKVFLLLLWKCPQTVGKLKKKIDNLYSEIKINFPKDFFCSNDEQLIRFSWEGKSPLAWRKLELFENAFESFLMKIWLVFLLFLAQSI